MMANTDYIYAAARIRSKELQCFSGAMLEQLMACKSYESVLRLLGEKGWAQALPTRPPKAF